MKHLSMKYMLANPSLIDADDIAQYAVMNTTDNDRQKSANIGILIIAYANTVRKSHLNDWVSVDTPDKPEDDQWLHCAIKLTDGSFSVCLPAYTYSKKYNTFTAYGEAIPDDRITHYQPLLSPPYQFEI